LQPAITRSNELPRTRLSRPARVAEEIKTWVVTQNLAPGDRLPNEQELIARFGMSKGTIREAMRILEAQGLVKTRTGPGGGSFVHAVSRERAWALLGNYFYFKNLSIADIYQLRLALEPELAASLAGTLSEDDLARLEANVAAFDAPPTSAEEERAFHVASLRFHQILAAHARNELLGFLVGFMANMLADLTICRGLYEPQNHELWRQGQEHQMALIAALRAGDAQGARDTMRAHMQAARALMADQEAEMERRFLKDR